MSGPVIRRAGVEDAGSLHRALERLAEHLGDTEKFRATAGDYERWGWGDTPLFRALVAEADGSTCGAAVYFPQFSTMRGRPGVFVQDLWVAEDLRGSGLGRRILREVVADAQSWGAAYMSLVAHATNPDAVAFYRRLGFRTDEREMSFLIEGDGFAALERGR